MKLKLAEIMESEPDYGRILEHFTDWKPDNLAIEQYAEMLQAFCEGWKMERDRIYVRHHER